MNNEFIKIKGAKENNLKNISIDIPKNKFVVITGVSGSGKSSLAFDTIYEDGRQKYLESLSSYARQFLKSGKKPNVDSIDGIQPTIAIDQKTTSHNPRSTIGTVTEIYDYLRLLFAKIGKTYCPNGHGIINAMTHQQIFEQILINLKSNEKMQILSPYIINSTNDLKSELEDIKKNGFSRIRINKKTYNLDEENINLLSKIHNIDIVIDRIIFHNDESTKTRINESLGIALKYGKNNVIILANENEMQYSCNHSCKICGFTFPDLDIKLFSFNTPCGACSTCSGIGVMYEPDENKIFKNKELSILDGGIDFFKNIINTTSLD
jgi:excinuclease ABC subunit A